MKLKFFIILALIAGVFLLLQRESTTKQMATQSVQAEEVAKTDKAIDDAVRFVSTGEKPVASIEVTPSGEGVIISQVGGSFTEMPLTNRERPRVFVSQEELEARREARKQQQSKNQNP